MRKAKKIKVGSVIQFPFYQFAPMRRGWNGWIFRAGIVDKLYTSKTGKKCAVIRYCARTAGRYHMMPSEEETKRIFVDYLYEYDIEWQRREYKKFRDIEKAGSKVCWDEDMALLVANGIITE